MSETQPPVLKPHGNAVTEVAGIIKILDPNMVAVLILTVVLNGMFFYVYMNLAQSRHTEFMAALNSCPAMSLRSMQP
jgi:hypothetical protein